MGVTTPVDVAHVGAGLLPSADTPTVRMEVRGREREAEMWGMAGRRTKRKRKIMLGRAGRKERALRRWLEGEYIFGGSCVFVSGIV